jgi:hypothetical protein
MTRSLEQIERDANDRSLHHRIIRLAARVAEWKVRKHEAGDAALLDDIPRRADYDRREAIRFKVSSDQTHGLVANWSEREEKRDVDGVSATEIEDGRRIVVDGSALAEVRWHAIKARRGNVDATDSGEFFEAADR